MAAVYAYIRVSTDTQDLVGQRLEILEFARRAGLAITDYIEVEASSRRDQRHRRIEELMSRLQSGDSVIVSELSRLGRSTAEVIEMVNELVRRQVGLVSVKQGFNLAAGGAMDLAGKVVVTVFSLLSELERDLVSMRTKEALRAKRQAGVKLGKPRGTIQRSKLDERRQDIEALLRHKVAKAAIARVCGTSRSNLENYLRTRGIA